jgi:uracil-DNA glycosylase family protein
MVRAAPATPGAEAFLPPRHTLPALRTAAQTCRGCPLYRDATQVVFGEGNAAARIALVGEVPGDIEDREGHVFVGPAGKLLDEALAAAGIPRGEAYLTNAVKHFKVTRRGKRRIHDKPTAYEIRACKPWLLEELGIVHPQILVLLGATATQALLGSAARVTQLRGKAFASPFAPHTFATVHPAAVLRAPPDTRAEARRAFFADLARVAKCLRARPAALGARA